jgi:hypothetical protein
MMILVANEAELEEKEIPLGFWHLLSHKTLLRRNRREPNIKIALNGLGSIYSTNTHTIRLCL